MNAITKELDVNKALQEKTTPAKMKNSRLRVMLMSKRAKK